MILMDGRQLGVVMAPCWDEKTLTGLRVELGAWFSARRRDLPWRGRDSLYGIWVSEIMLQQTVVNTVIPYYLRFMNRFPDVESLARADLDEVLELWSGLGYYRRARLLHEGARLVVSELGGRLPRSRRQWRRIPGVGEYASGAIASLGLAECVPAVDANARRVLLRWLCTDPGEAAAVTRRQLEDLAGAAVDPEAPGDWNEAVMELGALVCRARNPLCRECPVVHLCRAAGAGKAARVAVPDPQPKPMPVVLAQLVVVRQNRVLLTTSGSAPATVVPAGAKVLRGDLSDLHRGLSGLPTSAWFAPGVDLDPDRLWLPVLQAAGAAVASGEVRNRGTVRHAITCYRLQVHVHALRLPATGTGSGLTLPPEWGFHPYPLAGLPTSRLTEKVLSRALPAPG